MEQKVLSVEQIKKIAAKSKMHLGVMRQAFPDVFQKPVPAKYFTLREINVSTLLTPGEAHAGGFSSNNVIQISRSGEFGGIGFQLDKSLVWKLQRDSKKNVFLVPSRRIGKRKK